MSTAVTTLIAKISTEIFNPLIRLLVALAVVYFLWGVVKFIINIDDESARTEGKRHMVWGIIGIFIMISVWGIINVIETTFGI